MIHAMYRDNTERPWRAEGHTMRKFTIKLVVEDDLGVLRVERVDYKGTIRSLNETFYGRCCNLADAMQQQLNKMEGYDVKPIKERAKV